MDAIWGIGSNVPVIMCMCFLRAKAEDTNPDMEEKEKVKNEDFKKREKKDKS